MITRIESSNHMSWDYETFELTLFGKRILHSSIKNLISKVITLGSPTVPLGLTSFINGLIVLKTPITAFKDADSLNIRQNLLWIKKNNGHENFEKSVENEHIEPEETLNVGEETNPQTEVPLVKAKKRRFEETEEVGEQGNERRESKRLKLKANLKNSWKEFE